MWKKWENCLKMNEYSIFIKPSVVDKEGSRLAVLIVELGAKIITGNEKYAFSILYQGSQEELKEGLKERGCDLNTFYISPRIHVIVGDEFNPF